VNGAPKPIRPARLVETYAIELRDGSTIELPAAEVDRNGGRARHGDVELIIQWHEAVHA
jgi:hypothetical protein